MDEVSGENDLKKTVSAFLVPESVWRVISAFGISWVEVLGVCDGVIGLRESRDLS
jgi:hypothetical protein